LLEGCQRECMPADIGWPALSGGGYRASRRPTRDNAGLSNSSEGV
jgi:hypothetical protein